jgi:hypothetical protein
LSGRVATGIHQVAACVVVAKDATREELDLAEKILRRDPAHAAPAENASAIEAFNRLLDVPIDSANGSAHCGSRAERRARLAADLGRAGLVLIDSAKLAEFVDAKLEILKRELEAAKPEPEPAPLLELLAGDAYAYAATASSTETPFATVPGSALAGVTSADDLGAELHSSELDNSGVINVDSDPNVND